MALIGIGTNRKLNQALFGNFLTDAQDDRLYEKLRSANAMTAQVFNVQGHTAMTAISGRREPVDLS